MHRDTLSVSSAHSRVHSSAAVTARRRAAAIRCNPAAINTVSNTIAQPQWTRTMRLLVSALCLLMIISVVSLRPLYAADDDCAVRPDISYRPQQVVELVVESLRTNDDADSGIQQVFCFASPDNKSVTGPLERFTRMIKQGYGDMLNHRESYFDDMEVNNGIAMQPVWLITPDGDEVGYLFRLGLQQEGEFSGMWMTDAVSRIQRRDGDRKSI